MTGTIHNIYNICFSLITLIVLELANGGETYIRSKTLHM